MKRENRRGRHFGGPACFRDAASPAQASAVSVQFWLSLCSFTMLAYRRPCWSSTSGEPSSATQPWASTTILSAPATVRMRWAMISMVLFWISRDRACYISVSFSASREAAATKKAKALLMAAV